MNSKKRNKNTDLMDFTDVSLDENNSKVDLENIKI